MSKLLEWIIFEKNKRIEVWRYKHPSGVYGVPLFTINFKPFYVVGPGSLETGIDKS